MQLRASQQGVSPVALLSKPLSPAAESAARKLFDAALTLLADNPEYLFGQWSIADVDLALMLNRLILNGDSVPPHAGGVCAASMATTDRTGVGQIATSPDVVGTRIILGRVTCF